MSVSHFSPIIFVTCCLVCCSQIKAWPLAKRNLDPELTAGQFEGDMILSAAQLRAVKSKIQGRNGLVDETKRWPNNVMFYKILGNFDTVHRQAILDGMAIIEARSCVRFQQANSSQLHYVNITSEPGGCYTAVGYLAGVQQLNLEIYPIDEGCFRTGTIVHELMHALGFYHQQSDAHRNDFIEILYENIIPGKEFNFERYNSSFVTDFDVGYDYDSCLHYGPYAFSANGKQTIRPLDPKVHIGQRKGLSAKDILKINIMYKCLILI